MTRADTTLPRLFWVSPGEGLGDELAQRLAACVAGGLRGFQLREKASFPRRLAAAIPDLRRLLPNDGVFIVNDRVDVVEVTGADGVHLGHGSLAVAAVRAQLGPGAWIGRSVHDDVELAEAVDGGADYVFASPVFPVSKRGGPPAAPLGLVGLERVVERSAVPVLALGGITLDNIGQVASTGVHGIAVMRTLARAEDPRGLVAALLEALDE